MPGTEDASHLPACDTPPYRSIAKRARGRWVATPRATRVRPAGGALGGSKCALARSTHGSGGVRWVVLSALRAPPGAPARRPTVATQPSVASPSAVGCDWVPSEYSFHSGRVGRVAKPQTSANAPRTVFGRKRLCPPYSRVCKHSRACTRHQPHKFVFRPRMGYAPPRTSAFLCLHTSFLEKTSALRAPGVARRPGLSGRGPASAPRLNSRGAAHTGAQHPVGRPSLATVGAGATTTRCTCSGGGSVCLSSLSIIRSL